MISSAIHLLVLMTLTSSIAVVLVGATRKPLRYTAGARASYWIWLLVPVSVVGVLLPASSHPIRVPAEVFPPAVSAAYSAATVSMSESADSSYYTMILGLWLLGALIMIIWTVRRQQVFVRSIGEITPDPSGVYRSRSVDTPLLVGAWNARIVVPENFEERYSPEERNLVLAHERAHLKRHDVMINVFATVWLCLTWFNPLLYWALARLRFDQELACDEQVLTASQTPRRIYAEALLKTQLASESAWRVPAGCHWQSIHPLKERIAMLKRRSPGLARRLVGTAFVGVLTVLGGYATWAAQTDLPATGSSAKVIAVNMKWWVNGTDVLPGGSSTSHDIRVVSGKEFVRKVSFAAGQSFETRCFASLSNEDRQSPIWNTAKAFRKEGTDGLILLECKLSNDDSVFSTPALMVGDGKVGTIEVVNPEGTVRYKIEFHASTKPVRTATAR